MDFSFSDLNFNSVENLRGFEARAAFTVNSTKFIHYIRLNESDFVEWYKSETAKLFAPPIFRNEKKATGYFF